MQITDYRRLAVALPGIILGGDGPGGFNEAADVLHRAADGTDLNEFFAEVQQAVAARNAQRSRLVDQLTFRVSGLVEEVTLPGSADFEKASEYGLPKGIRTGVDRFWRGFDFDFFDLSIRFTWRFLAEADIRQMRQLVNQALEADNRLIFGRIMRALFNPINGSGITDNNLPVTVYRFYNGDGETPPQVKNSQFNGQHNHYLTTAGIGQGNALTPLGVDRMTVELDHHGYTYQSGFRKVLWVNKQEADIIRTWTRLNGAKFDFLQTEGLDGGYIVPTDTRIVGQPQGNLQGQIGTYGPWHIVEEEYIPPGYLVGLVSGGPDNIGNPIGIREHANEAYRGLKILPGDRNGYPLIESYFQRGMGTGIRHRGAGVILQVSAANTYQAPAQYPEA